MKFRSAAPVAACVAFIGAMSSFPAAAEYYSGKTITLLVGYGAGGSTDIFVRAFVPYLKKHMPGKPEIIVQNMPGAAAIKATNYVYERAKKDGLTLFFSPWNPIGAITKARGLRAKYSEFAFIGGGANQRVSYIRSDVAPGIKAPADIMKAKGFKLGGAGPTSNLDIVGRLSLDLLGVDYVYVPGYRGSAKISAALRRNEIQMHTTVVTAYRAKYEDTIIKTGIATPLWYYSDVTADGKIRPSDAFPGLSSFAAVYRQIKGSLPTGIKWKAMNWMAATGRLVQTLMGPPGTPRAAVADLRAGFDKAKVDKAFVAQMKKQFGAPMAFVSREEGVEIMKMAETIEPELAAFFVSYTKGRSR